MRQKNSTKFNSTDANYFLCFCEKLQNKQKNKSETNIFI